MAAQRAYDLLVLIDADAPEERRGQILEGVKNQIRSGDGELKADVDWGVRKLAYEIRHRRDAYYHLFQLEAGPELLKQLEHSLAIDDAVLRHRIILLPKGVPEQPPRPTPSAPRQAQPAEDESAPEDAAQEASPEASRETPQEASQEPAPEPTQAPG
jgi:small subunit ribosomal protein S6